LLPNALRIIARSLRRPMNREELKGPAPALLSHLLHFVLSSPPTLNESASNESAAEDTSGSIDNSKEHSMEKSRERERDRERDRDKELVHACMLLAHMPRPGDHLKNHLMEHLLLHLPLWAPSHLSTQRALLAAVGDAVSLELQALQSVGAVSLLLDGCRRCYWMTWEPSSVRLCTASWHPTRLAALVKGGAGEAGGAGGGEWGREEMQEERMGMMGEVNGMVNAVMGALEKLVCAGVGLDVMGADMRALVSFALQCPQPNQVARVLLLLYRLMSQPNSSRASAFMVQFLASGGAEMLLALLLRETQYGETYPVSFPAKSGSRPIRRRLVPVPGGEGLENEAGEGIGGVEGGREGELGGKGEGEEEGARKVLVFEDGKGGAGEGQGGAESGREDSKEGGEVAESGGKEGEDRGEGEREGQQEKGEDSEKACGKDSIKEGESGEGISEEGDKKEDVSEKESEGKEEKKEEGKKEEEESKSKPKQEAAKGGGVWDLSTWNVFLEPLGLKVGSIDDKKTEAEKPESAAGKEGGKRGSKAAAGVGGGAGAAGTGSRSGSSGLSQDAAGGEQSGAGKEQERGMEEGEEEDGEEDTRRGVAEVAAVVARLRAKQVYEDDAEESAVQVTKEGMAVLAPWVCVSVPRLARTGPASGSSLVKSASSHASGAAAAAAAAAVAAAAAAVAKVASWDGGGGNRGVGASSSAGSSGTIVRSGSGHASAGRAEGRVAYRSSSHGASTITAGSAAAAAAAAAGVTASAAAAAADAFWLSGWMVEGTAMAAAEGTATAAAGAATGAVTDADTAAVADAAAGATAGAATATADAADFYFDSDQGFLLTDSPDAIMVAVISILGLLADAGFLRLSDPSVLGVVPTTEGLGAVVTERAGKDRSNVGAWAVYGVQRALQVAPKRLFTPAVYHALMTAVLRCKAVDSPSALLPPSTFIAPWEQQLLLALLRALPSAAPHTQLAVLQDLLLLLSLNPANTRLLTHSPEWPEWLLEILLSNLEVRDR
ncbi:unnamed protein product, partial [Closterium sp. NIES-53]